MNEIEVLPKGWIQATLGDVCSQPQYGYTTKASNTGDLRLLRTTDITRKRINWKIVPYCSTNPKNIESYLLEDGDIVVSRAGSVGVSYLVTKPQKAVFASYLIRFKPLIDKQFLAYFLESPIYWITIAEKKLGIAVPNVNATKLKAIPISIPPLNEQHRIVAKIEELFSEIDKGVENLGKAMGTSGGPHKIAALRQSILKQAFSGQLVAQDPNDEPASVLLERIKAK